MSAKLERAPLYAAGDCPVCPGAGVLLFLRRSDARQYFFFCTHCGNAYRERPDPPNACNEVNALDDVAPRGIVLPHKEEIANVRGLVTAQPDAFEELMWHVERSYADAQDAPSEKP
ncbi:MAG: hypothetical protein H0T89_26050 [Deltaproteobacteria bacterium]|nr:hypothetical protein [Deltaproteobacteria bacterium]MDQ3297626.1 hypothetical protein [Myxococcota bacterium]